MLRINGETADPGLIEDAFARLKAEAEMLSEVSCCERDGEFRQRAEDEVIDGILLAQEAERRTAEPSPAEVREAFEQTLRQWREHGASWDLLDAQRESLRAETISRLRMESFTEGLWRDLPELTEEDLRAWYLDHIGRFRDDYAAILDLRHRALECEDFDELAREHTGKSNGEIDLGWIEQQRIFNPFEAMLFSLREGEIGPVFFYEQALHLVKAVEIRPSVVQAFDEIAESIREEVEHARRLQMLKELAGKLRETAVIERE